MTQGPARTAVKRALGVVPLTAELIQWLRPTPEGPTGGYSLARLAQALPEWVAAASEARRSVSSDRPQRVLVMGYLSWWLEYACAVGLYLAGMGHKVDLAFLPYRRWMLQVEPFDVRRQRAYMRRILGAMRPLVGLRDLSASSAALLPADLAQSIEELSQIDVQYTAMRERLDLIPGSRDSDLLELRLERNRVAARAAYALLRDGAYGVVLIPNGSVLEFGAVYRTARHLGVRTITYEFGEQRERMWLAQDAEVMRLDTSDLWQARGGTPLTEPEEKALEDLYRARRGGHLWANFRRRWQVGESQGAQAARQQLGIDAKRPMALLCTNVVGDSLALGRQVFASGMADWLAATVRHFAQHPERQLVVRVHPAELILVGDPSVEIVNAALPELPAHVIVVPPESKINTYDLIELAHLGLAYTTTVGMEMVMGGVPVISAGQSHYRGKGFTCDPTSLEDYLAAIDDLMAQPLGRRLETAQKDLARRYAYRFFFEYPFPFPWHLIQFWEDVAARPLKTVLMPEYRQRYQPTLEALLGEPIGWARPASGA